MAHLLGFGVNGNRAVGQYHRHSALASYLVVGEMTAHADHTNKGKPGTFKKQLGTKK